MPKRNAPGIGFSLPPPKRQSTLTSRKQAVAQPKAAAEPLPADSSCRFTGEGYIQALVKKHASDERYREFFCKNSVQDVGKLLRRCFTPALLEVLDHRREDDLAAYVYTHKSDTQLITSTDCSALATTSTTRVPDGT
jgi:hypothetical protein